MLKVYPRGYVGPVLDNKDEKRTSIQNELIIVQNTFKLDSKISDKEITPDRDIIKMFDQYQKDQNILLRFDFREEIISTAKEFFTLDGKTRSFKTFLKVQLNSGKITYNHVEVLKEILDFVFYGKEGFKIVTWERILSNDEKPVYLSDKTKEELSKIFDNHKVYDQNIINDVNKTLQKWLTNQNGHSHLLRVLWLFFGDFAEDGIL